MPNFVETASVETASSMDSTVIDPVSALASIVVPEPVVIPEPVSPIEPAVQSIPEPISAPIIEEPAVPEIKSHI